MDNNNIENNEKNVQEKPKKIKPKKNSKKFLGNIFLFGSFIIATSLLIALPLTLNSKLKQKRNKFFDDDNLNIKTKFNAQEIKKDKEYDLTFSQEKNDINNTKNKILNNARLLNTSSPWKNITPPLFKVNSDVVFLNKEHAYSKYYQNIYSSLEENKKNYLRSITSSKENIYKFDYLNFLKKYYKDKFKNEKDLKKLGNLINENLNDNAIKALERIFINFTYVFKHMNNYYYQDINNGYLGINIRNFIKKINDELSNFRKKYPNKKITFRILESTFELKAKFNDDKTTLNKIYMNSIFKIKAIIE